MPAWAARPTEVEVDLAPSQHPPPRRTALYLLCESHLGWGWVSPSESNRALPPLSISASIIILKVSTQGPMDLPVDTQLKGASLIATSYTRLIKNFFSMCLYKLVLSSPAFTHTLPPPNLLLQHAVAQTHWRSESRQRAIQFLPKYREPSTFVRVIHEHI